MPAERIFRLSVDPASISVVAWLGEEPFVECVNQRSSDSRSAPT